MLLRSNMESAKHTLMKALPKTSENVFNTPEIEIHLNYLILCKEHMGKFLLNH